MIDKYMNEYLVGNIKTTKTRQSLGIISIEKPTEDAVAVEKSGRCISILFWRKIGGKTRCLN